MEDIAMTTNTVPVHTARRSVSAAHEKYRVERRYEGDRTAAQLIGALMKVHDSRGAA